MSLMNATTYQHPTASPISLRIDDRFPGTIHAEVVDSCRAEITVSTDDTSGPAFDAVRDTRITADGDTVRVAVSAAPGGAMVTTTRGGGVNMVFNQTVGAVYGSVDAVTIVNGRVVSGGTTASSPVLVHVRLPQGSALSVATGSSDLELVGGPLARVDFDAGSGDLIGVCCDVVDARTGSGDIRVRAMGSGSLRTGSGDVVIDMAGTVTARTGSGDIRLSRCAGPASLSTGSGDVTAPEAAEVHTGQGRIRRIGEDR